MRWLSTGPRLVKPARHAGGGRAKGPPRDAKPPAPNFAPAQRAEPLAPMRSPTRVRAAPVLLPTVGCRFVPPRPPAEPLAAKPMKRHRRRQRGAKRCACRRTPRPASGPRARHASGPVVGRLLRSGDDRSPAARARLALEHVVVAAMIPVARPERAHRPPRPDRAYRATR